MAEARARLLRGLVPGVQAGIASGAAWAVARALGHEWPIFAPIAALVAIGATASGRFARSIELTLGVAIGILAGDLARAAFGHSGWSIAIAVFLAIGFARLLDERPLLLRQAGISAVLAVVLDPRDGVLILARLADAGVGVAVAVVVAALVLPPRPDGLVDRALAQLREALSAVLGESADALADVDTPRAERALDRARTLDEELSVLDETLQVAHEALLTRPLRARDRERVAEVRKAAPQPDLAVRNVRVLARAVARHARAGVRPPDDLVTAIRELRAAAGALLRDGPALERHTLDAVAQGERASAGRGDLAVHAVVGQLRSLAVDLLRASGLEHDMALSRVATAGVVGREHLLRAPEDHQERVTTAHSAIPQARVDDTTTHNQCEKGEEMAVSGNVKKVGKQASEAAAEKKREIKEAVREAEVAVDAVELSQPKHTVASYSKYRDAERAVDWLSDQGFAVERSAIVGSGLRSVEQVTGRFTSGRAALLGAGEGALMGSLFAFLFGIFFSGPDFAGLLLYALVVGATVGALFGASMQYARSGGRRDFASATDIEADRYDVQVDGAVANEAKRLLDAMPAGR